MMFVAKKCWTLVSVTSSLWVSTVQVVFFHLHRMREPQITYKLLFLEVTLPISCRVHWNESHITYLHLDFFLPSSIVFIVSSPDHGNHFTWLQYKCISVIVFLKRLFNGSWVLCSIVPVQESFAVIPVKLLLAYSNIFCCEFNFRNHYS